MGIIIFTGMVVLCAAAIYFILQARKQRKYEVATRTAKYLAALIALYMLGLLAFSILAPTKPAAGGEIQFCGVDPTCDLSAAPVQVLYLKTIGDPPSELVAAGMYYVVTVRVISRRGTAGIRPDLTGFVEDSRGRRFPQETLVERAYRAAQQRARTSIPPAPQGTYRTTMIFDLPSDVERPAIVLREGGVFEQLLELLLIGDEASLFYPETRLRLLTPEEVSAR